MIACNDSTKSCARIPVACLIRFTMMGILLAAQAARGEESDARRQLRMAGLVEAGNYWLCRDEVELRRNLAELEQLERAYYPAQRQYKQMISRYFALRGELKQAEESLAELQSRLSQSSATTVQRQQLESESKKLTEKIEESEKEIKRRLNALDEHSEMTAAVIELVNVRNELSVTLLAVVRRLNALNPQYDRARENSLVKSALASLGDTVKLGPAENYLAQNRAAIVRVAALTLTDGVPVYRRSGQYRLTVIINEETPATLSYTGPSGPTILTAGMLQQSGIDLDPFAPQTILADGDRKISARRITISKLRIGRFVYHDVKALALPPEAEDLGGRISTEALGTHHAQLDPDRLWLQIVPPETDGD